MPTLKTLARQTRRGLFGNLVSSSAWESALADFQAARNELTRTLIQLSELCDSAEDPALIAIYDAVERQIMIMDGSARTILTASHIANGVEDFFPGFNGVNVAAAFGLDRIAAPVTIAMLRSLTSGAKNVIVRANALIAGPLPIANRTGPSGLEAHHGLGQYTPWGSIGGDVWEWWHAEKVQREYEAVGKPAPSIEEIESGALTDIGKRVGEGAANVFSGTKTIMIAAAVIAVAVFVAPRVLGRVK